jgi:hypothetical protein
MCVFLASTSVPFISTNGAIAKFIVLVETKWITVKSTKKSPKLSLSGFLMEAGEGGDVGIAL